MANVLYPEGKDNILSGNIDLLNDTIKAVLIDTGTYTYNTAHDAYDDLSGVVGTATTIANITVTSGVVDGDDVTFSSVTGNSVEAIVIYKDSGTPSTSYLIAYIDSASAGLPVTPNGGDITIQWSSGANKIFALNDPA